MVAVCGVFGGDLLPTGFWLAAAALALGFALETLPPRIEPLAYEVLWFGGLIAAAVSILAYVIALKSAGVAGFRPCPPRKRAYRSVAGHLRLALQVALLGAIWAAGTLWLAVLYLVAIIASIGASETCARLSERR